MPRIRGTYEYDDDEDHPLVPGRSKDGGLHQNLYDTQGVLKRHARFVPSGRSEPEPERDPVYVYVETGPAQPTPAEQLTETVVELLLLLTVAKATPHARRLWEQRARPVVQAGWEKRPRRGTRAAQQLLDATSPPVAVEGEVVESGLAAETAPVDDRPRMSAQEAQERLLMALRARVFSEEQLRVVSEARIEDDAVFAELGEALAGLSLEQVTGITERLEADPAALDDATLTALREAVGRLQQGQAGDTPPAQADPPEDQQRRPRQRAVTMSLGEW